MAAKVKAKRRVARSPRHGFEPVRKRGKASPFQSAVSMFTSYRARASKSFSARRKAIRKAADDLRRLFTRKLIAPRA
jgi:hypothetical protein